jgi:hypothetical protein
MAQVQGVRGLKSRTSAHLLTDVFFFPLSHEAEPTSIHTQLSYDFIAVATVKVSGVYPVPEFAGKAGLDGRCEGEVFTLLIRGRWLFGDYYACQFYGAKSWVKIENLTLLPF